MQSHVSSQCTVGAESNMAVVARLEGGGGGVEVEGKTLLRLQTFGAPLPSLLVVIPHHLVRQEHLMRMSMRGKQVKMRRRHLVTM